ncbi:MAG TPA: ECF-type sigma factor [Chthoniobacterales bacterium]
MSDSTPEPSNSSDVRSDKLLAELYERLRAMAMKQIMKESDPQTLQATALVHEAWLRMTSGEDRTWKDTAYFCAAAAQTMRRILIENARRKSRVRHGGKMERASSIEMDEVPETMPEEAVLRIDEGLTELEKANPERAQIVSLKFYGGLTNEEVAQALRVSTRTVEREWACAKNWLYRWMSKED